MPALSTIAVGGGTRMMTTTLSNEIVWRQAGKKTAVYRFQTAIARVAEPCHITTASKIIVKSFSARIIKRTGKNQRLQVWCRRRR